MNETTAASAGTDRAAPGGEATEALAVYAELDRLGLLPYAAELDILGLTVIPPELAAPAGFIDQVRERVLDVAERRDGARPDVEGGSTHADHFLPNYHYLLFEDPIFADLMLMPSALALVTKLLGDSATLSTCAAIIKGPAKDGAGLLHLGLHSDNEGHPPPFPLFAQYANATWLLTDYTRAGGALAYVPGSHLLCRQPLPGEARDQVVPVEAPAGSLVLWHSNTWHGSFRRQIPGLRVTVALLYGRKFLLPREPYREDVTQEMLDRQPARFATLMGKDLAAGWRSAGPDFTNVKPTSTPGLYS